jgi:hypothetical protein
MTLGASGCTAIDALRSNCGVAADFDELTFAFGGGNDHLNDTGYAIPLALTVDGGSGNDVLGGGTLDDALDGGPGGDIVVGAGGDDDLTGEDGNDVIRGEGGVDLLDGGDGDDYLAARENPATRSPTTAKPSTRHTSTASSTSQAMRGRATRLASRCRRTSAAKGRRPSSGSAAARRAPSAARSPARRARRTRSRATTSGCVCVPGIRSTTRWVATGWSRRSRRWSPRPCARRPRRARHARQRRDRHGRCRCPSS